MLLLPLLLTLASQPRDVLATAWDAPLLCDAEVLLYRSNHRARLRLTAPECWLDAPSPGWLLVDGQEVGRSLTGGLFRFSATPGEHEVEFRPAALPRQALSVTLPQGLPPTELGDAGGRIKSGVYTDLEWTIASGGTAERPRVIEPAVPGWVTCRGRTRIRITAPHVVLKGLRFEHTPNDTLRIEADDVRVTQCQFFGAGNPQSTFGSIVTVGQSASRCRVDHCYFTGSKSMSLAQRITTAPVGRGNRFDGNIFRDIYRYWINGQENIQLGQNQRGETGAQEPGTLVEGNLFDHAWGDGEIISNKSSGNTIRHNLAAWCRRSAFTLRGGDRVAFVGNTVVGCGDGLRVMGTRHTIANNLILACGDGIVFEPGSVDGQNQVAGDDCLVAHNTIYGGTGASVVIQTPREGRPHLPQRVTFAHNLLAARGDREDYAASVVEARLVANRLVGDPPVDFARWREPHAGLAVTAPVDRLPAVPDDRWGRPRATRTSAGCDEPGAGPATVELPDLPPPPLVEPGLYYGPTLREEALDRPRELTNATLDLGATELPLALTWEYHPTEFATVAGLTIGDLSLTWGGAADDGKPTGLIELRQGERLLSQAADLVQYSQNYRYQGWMNVTPRTDTRPAEGLWYEFVLLLHGNRLDLLIGEAGRGVTPVLLDRVRPQTAVTVAARQQGTGQWRNLRLRRYDYLGDRPLPALTPPQVTATGSVVKLAWPDPLPAAASLTVHRGDRLGFTPEAATLIGAGLTGPVVVDTGLVPDRSYVYRLRLEQPLGRVTDWLELAVTPAVSECSYLAVDLTRPAVCRPPLLVQTASGRPFLGAPTNAAPAMAGPPEDSLAEYRVTLPRAGTWQVWAFCRTFDEATNSFYARLTGWRDGAWQIWYLPVQPGGGWNKLATPLQLPAGELVLGLKHREPGTRLEALLVTDDPRFDPTRP